MIKLVGLFGYVVMLIYFKIPFLFLFVCLASCSTMGESGVGWGDGIKNEIEENDAYVTEFPRSSTPQDSFRVSEAVFRPGDVIDVHVYNIPSLTSSYTVDPVGDVSFPLIGTVEVSGMSRSELQTDLVERYGSRYLQNPIVNVSLEAREVGRFVMDGAVTRPGVYDVGDSILLTEAIAKAGGVDNDQTNGSDIFIVRTVDGERYVRSVDLRAIRSLKVEDSVIFPNDVIFVQDSAGRVAFREFIKASPILNAAFLFSAR